MHLQFSGVHVGQVVYYILHGRFVIHGYDDTVWDRCPSRIPPYGEISDGQLSCVQRYDKREC